MTLTGHLDIEGISKADSAPFLPTQVSIRHAHIFRDFGDYWVEDLGSAKGTWLNGTRLSRNNKQRLNPGDSLAFGLKDASDLTYSIKRAHHTVWEQLQGLNGGSKDGSIDVQPESREAIPA